jgi:hypothetical protein
MLAEQFDMKRPGRVFSGDLLQEQSDSFFQVAAALAHNILSECRTCSHYSDACDHLCMYSIVFDCMIV